MKPKILISACLVGENVKYDGGHNLCEHHLLKQWQEDGCLVLACPEVLGGMSTPRVPCEVQQGTFRVKNKQGEECTHFFKSGTEKTCALVLKENIHMAILKARSPSCGKGLIYDGSFSRTLVQADGITCKALQEQGIRVFCEDELEEAHRYWQSLKTQQSF